MGAKAGNLLGQASVIDGATFEIHGQRIRLHGIDAPEGGQTCTADGKTYRCDQQAALALADKIGRETVRCQPKDTDRYGRVVAVCPASAPKTQTLGWRFKAGHWPIVNNQPTMCGRRIRPGRARQGYGVESSRGRGSFAA